jgi:hypothetical protein
MSQAIFDADFVPRDELEVLAKIGTTIDYVFSDH